MSRLVLTDVQAALEEGWLLDVGQVARTLVEQGYTDLPALAQLIEPGNRQGFILGLFDMAGPQQYQAALAVLDVLIRAGYDVNEIDEDEILDKDNFYTVLDWASLELNVLAVRALLSRGVDPELSRAEAFYNLLRADTSAPERARAAAYIGIMLLQAGLNPRLIRPSQFQMLFGDRPLALLALPGTIRERLPGMGDVSILNQAEAGLRRALGTSLHRCLLARM